MLSDRFLYIVISLDMKNYEKYFILIDIAPVHVCIARVVYNTIINHISPHSFQFPFNYNILFYVEIQVHRF